MSQSSLNSNYSIKEIDGGDKDDKYAGRLSKRLCYILRYGAIKEGLTVHKEGFIDLREVMGVHMMRHHTDEEVLHEVDTSLSHRRTKRFESKLFNGKTFIRALFCRNFEPSPFHEGTMVKTLQQSCMDYVLDNIEDYDLEDFPDENIINGMISQQKRKKKLSGKMLRQLLVPVLEHLDLDSVYITQSVLKTMWTSCLNLKVLSLKDCGYIVTDSIIETILRKLTKLESLNLAACKHLTDKSTKAMCKFGKNLRQLNLSWIRTITNGAILDLVVNLEKLEHLDIYDMKLQEEFRELVIEGARQRGIKIVLKGLQESDPDVTIENPSMMLPNFGKTW